jgi:hypothetical protein
LNGACFCPDYIAIVIGHSLNEEVGFVTQMERRNEDQVTFGAWWGLCCSCGFHIKMRQIEVVNIVLRFCRFWKVGNYWEMGGSDVGVANADAGESLWQMRTGLVIGEDADQGRKLCRFCKVFLFCLDTKKKQKKSRLRRTFLKIMRHAGKKTNSALPVVLLHLSVTFGPLRLKSTLPQTAFSCFWLRLHYFLNGNCAEAGGRIQIQTTGY